MNKIQITNSIYLELQELLKTNQKLNFVKVLKQTTNLSLKESKEVLDSLNFFNLDKSFQDTFEIINGKSPLEVTPEEFLFLENSLKTKTPLEFVRDLKLTAFISLLEAKEYWDLIKEFPKDDAMEKYFKIKVNYELNFKFPYHCIIDGKVGYVMPLEEKLYFFHNQDSFTIGFRIINKSDLDYAQKIGD